MLRQNEKLTSDIEELLEEFTELKTKYQTLGDDLRKKDVELADYRRLN